MDYPWIDAVWPVSEGHEQISHLHPEDLRRWLVLATVSRYSHSEGCEFGAQDNDNPLRFAPAWKDWMQPYSDALTINWTHAGITHPDMDVRPGAIVVWYEDNFSAQISGVIKTVDPKGEFVIENCSEIHLPIGIYNVNSTGYLVPTTESSFYKEYDNFRPGTPFILENCSNPVNNGFYRVRSRRMDGSTLFISVDNNDYVQQELDAGNCTGTLVCDFGGDWWTLRGMEGHCDIAFMTGGHGTNAYFAELGDNTYVGSTSERWWTDKDAYHRYPPTQNNGRGPNDGRPPSGGQLAIDFNKDWVRGINPNLYHCYDKNAHRWYIHCDANLNMNNHGYSEEYIAVIPSYRFLPAQCDPKEQISPYFFKNTLRRHWKYGGKVPLRKEQITNADKLGAIQSVRENGYITLSYAKIPASSDRQYGSTYIYEHGYISEVVNGTMPAVPGQSQLPRSVNEKYDAALQNMVELACEEYGWCWPVDNIYKTNWLILHSADYMPIALEYYLNGTQSGTYTYGEGYSYYGLNAYNSQLDSSQQQLALLNDELWGENGSAFEKILQLLGSNYYDWYYDEIYPYMSARVLNERWRWKATEEKTEEEAEQHWPHPHGTWRRTWKHSLGYVREGKMRDSSLGDPQCHTYSDYSDPPSGYGGGIMFGHIRMTAPSETDYGGENLKYNHGEEFVINDTKVYTRVWRILNDCYQVLSKLIYNSISAEVSQVWSGWEDLRVLFGYYSREELLSAYEASHQANWNDDMTTWPVYYEKIPIGHSVDFCFDKYFQKWMGSSGGAYSEGAIRFNTPLACERTAVSFLVALEIRGGNEDPRESRSKSLMGIPGLGTIETPENISDKIYVYVPVRSNSNSVQYLRLKMLGGFDNWVYHGETQYDITWLTNTVSFFMVRTSDLRLIAQYNWSKYPDSTWIRTIERADYKLIDSFGPDANPPVVRNDWFIQPTLYDANFPVDEYADGLPWPYDNPNYEPLWKIKAESVLLEDLEDNGVYYILDFNDSALDTEQTSRKFDILLTVTGSSSEAGSKEAAFDALSILTSGITAALNTRDNYNARGLGRPNNYNTPTASEELIIDAPMFPVNARFVPASGEVPTNPSYLYFEEDGVGTNYLLICVDNPIPGQNAESVTRRLEGYYTSTGQWDEVCDLEDSEMFAVCTNPSILSHLPNTWKTSDKTIYIANLDVYTSLLDWSKFRIHYVNNLGERSVRSVEVVPDNWNIII